VFFGRVDWWTAGPLHLIAPDPATIQPTALAIALLSGWLLLMRHVNLIIVLGIAAFAGAALSAL
jgi:chromate transporter